jgi:tetratricopeptide (TPR) repeat protein
VRITIYIFHILWLSFFSQYVFSQNPDSLKQVLKNATHDTVRVKLLVELSDVCEIEEIDSYVNQALAICNKKLKNKSITERERFLFFKYAGAALNNKGFINDQIGKTDKAIIYYELALKMQEFIKDQKGMAYTLNNIAFIYDNKGDVPKSLEYMHKALKMQEEIQSY